MTEPGRPGAVSEAESPSATQPLGQPTTCPSCAAPVGVGEHYCEACGAELVDSSPASDAVPAEHVDSGKLAPDAAQAGPAQCHECDGEIAADGYCTNCGAKARSPRDHFTEQPAAWVAAVCDRGVRHSRNEDAVALDARTEPGSHAVLVVCDGVSNSTDSDVASLAAARAARDVLARSSASGIGTAGSRVAATAQALDAAADAANEAVIQHTVEGPGNPPSCTFVAAVVHAGPLVVGWVGDSRAYWFPTPASPAAHRRRLVRRRADRARDRPRGGRDRPAGPRDHPLARDRRTRPHPAHALCRSLEAGWVLVCSDGLWNYCSEPPTWRHWCCDTARDGGAADPLRPGRRTGRLGECAGRG